MEQGGDFQRISPAPHSVVALNFTVASRELFLIVNFRLHVLIGKAAMNTQRLWSL